MGTHATPVQKKAAAKTPAVQRKDADQEVNRKSFADDTAFVDNKKQTGLQAMHSTIQAKLNMGQPGDKFEKEADDTAASVMSKPMVQKAELAPVEEGVQAKSKAVQRKDEDVQLQTGEDTISQKSFLQTSSSDTGGKELQAELFEEKQDIPNDMVNAKENSGGEGNAGSSFESSLQASKGKGESMSPDLQSEMGTRFGGQDFSGVKIHTDSNAAEMSSQINAKAFTNQSDIYFNSGQFDGNSTSGKTLLAHELTHTVQQGGRNGVNHSINRKELKDAGKDQFPKSSRNGDHSYFNLPTSKSWLSKPERLVVATETNGYKLIIHANAPVKKGPGLSGPGEKESRFEGEDNTIPAISGREEEKGTVYPIGEWEIGNYTYTLHTTIGSARVYFNTKIIKEVEIRTGKLTMYETVKDWAGSEASERSIMAVMRSFTPLEAEAFMLDAALAKKIAKNMKPALFARAVGLWYQPLGKKLKYLIAGREDDEQIVSDKNIREMVLKSDRSGFKLENWIDWIARYVEFTSRVVQLLSDLDIPESEWKYYRKKIKKAVEDYDDVIVDEHEDEFKKKKLKPRYYDDLVESRELDYFGEEGFDLMFRIESGTASTNDKQEYLDMFLHNGIRVAHAMLDEAEAESLDFYRNMIDGEWEKIKTILQEQSSVIDEAIHNMQPLDTPGMTEMNAIWAMDDLRDTLGELHPIFYSKNFDIIGLYEDLQGEGDSTQNEMVQQTLHQVALDSLDNINTTRKNLRSDPQLVWKMDKVVEVTNHHLNFTGSEKLNTIVTDKVEQVEFDDMIVDMALAAISIIAGFMTFGSGWVGTAGLLTSLFAGAIDTSRMIERYNIDHAASNVSIFEELDLSSKDPSKAWIIIGVLGMILDAGGLASLAKAPGTAAKLDFLRSLNSFNKILNEDQLKAFISNVDAVLAKLKFTKEQVNYDTLIAIARLKLEFNASVLGAKTKVLGAIRNVLASTGIDFNPLDLFTAMDMLFAKRLSTVDLNALPTTLLATADDIAELEKNVLKAVNVRAAEQTAHFLRLSGRMNEVPVLTRIMEVITGTGDRVMNGAAFLLTRRFKQLEAAGDFDGIARLVNQVDRILNCSSRPVDNFGYFIQVLARNSGSSEELVKEIETLAKLTQIPDAQFKVIAQKLRNADKFGIEEIRWINKYAPEMSDAALKVLNDKLAKTSTHFRNFTKSVDEQLIAINDVSKVLTELGTEMTVGGRFANFNDGATALQKGLIILGESEPVLVKLFKGQGSGLKSKLSSAIKEVIESVPVSSTDKLSVVRGTIVKKLNTKLAKVYKDDYDGLMRLFEIYKQPGSTGAIFEQWVVQSDSGLLGKLTEMFGGTRVIFDNYRFSGAKIVGVEIKNMISGNKLTGHALEQLFRYQKIIKAEGGTIKSIEYIFSTFEAAQANKGIIQSVLGEANVTIFFFNPKLNKFDILP